MERAAFITNLSGFRQYFTEAYDSLQRALFATPMATPPNEWSEQQKATVERWLTSMAATPEDAGQLLREMRENLPAWATPEQAADVLRQVQADVQAAQIFQPGTFSLDPFQWGASDARYEWARKYVARLNALGTGKSESHLRHRWVAGEHPDRIQAVNSMEFEMSGSYACRLATQLSNLDLIVESPFVLPVKVDLQEIRGALMFKKELHTSKKHEWTIVGHKWVEAAELQEQPADGAQQVKMKVGITSIPTSRSAKLFLTSICESLPNFRRVLLALKHFLQTSNIHGRFFGHIPQVGFIWMLLFFMERTCSWPSYLDFMSAGADRGRRFTPAFIGASHLNGWLTDDVGMAERTFFSFVDWFCGLELLQFEVNYGESKITPLQRVDLLPNHNDLVYLSIIDPTDLANNMADRLDRADKYRAMREAFAALKENRVL